MTTVTHTSLCAEIRYQSPHTPLMHPITLARNLNLAVVRRGIVSAKLHMLLMIWCNFFFLNPAATSSFTAGARIPCLHWRWFCMSEGYRQRAGGWVQPLVDKGPGRFAKAPGFRLHYPGWQLALWTAPWQLRTEKENGAETKSSASIWPLSAPEFAVMARKYCKIGACKMNTTSGPFGKTRKAEKTRGANGHLRPLFWTIAAREVRRGDLVSGTPFLSFGN